MAFHLQIEVTRDMSETNYSRFAVFGDIRVGKTWLMHRFAGQPLENAIGHFPPVGRSLAVDGGTIHVQVMDTLGHDRTFQLTIDCAEMCAAVLLVYDVTNRSTFERLPFWLSRFKTHLRHDAVVTLVGNKCDLVAEREVTSEEGERFAGAVDLSFVEVSAKTGLNVDAAFVITAQQVLRTLKKKPNDFKKKNCLIS